MSNHCVILTQDSQPECLEADKNYNFLTQVMKTENGDKSVPITWAYNHHFEAYLSGSYSEMKQLSVAAYPFGHHNHGAPTFW